MKYLRLTKEQLEELYPEFINFLATQAIDKNEWDELKKNKPQVALQEIDVFSDLIWDKVLKNVRFVDHFSENYIFLFQCLEDELRSIIVTSKKDDIDFTSKEGIEWLSENFKSNQIDFQKGIKKVTENNRNEEIFELIKKGGMISKGELYIKLTTLLNIQ
jgi:hypothetical protein